MLVAFIVKQLSFLHTNIHEYEKFIIELIAMKANLIEGTPKKVNAKS